MIGKGDQAGSRGGDGSAVHPARANHGANRGELVHLERRGHRIPRYVDNRRVLLIGQVDRKIDIRKPARGRGLLVGDANFYRAGWARWSFEIEQSLVGGWGCAVVPDLQEGSLFVGGIFDDLKGLRVCAAGDAVGKVVIDVIIGDVQRDQGYPWVGGIAGPGSVFSQGVGRLGIGNDGGIAAIHNADRKNFDARILVIAVQYLYANVKNRARFRNRRLLWRSGSRPRG